MSVTLVYRRLTSGSFSMERLFRLISSHYGAQINVREKVIPFESRGVVARLKNLLWALRQRSHLFHVTGDVHYITLALPPRRTILTVHDCVSVLHAPKSLRRVIIRWVWFVLPARRAAAVVAISEQTREDLAVVARLPKERIRVIPNCVDPRFEAMDRIFDQRKPRILQIGQAKNKNIPRLAAALEGIPSHLHIVGKIHPETLAALNAHRVEWSNSIDIPFERLLNEYSRADIVAFVSTYEGFGLPILEAQAVGRPLITSDLSPMREIAGSGAMLVDPYDVGAIRTGFLRVIESPSLRESIVTHGLLNSKTYSARSVADQYQTLYAEIEHSLNREKRHR